MKQDWRQQVSGRRHPLASTSFASLAGWKELIVLVSANNKPCRNPGPPQDTVLNWNLQFGGEEGLPVCCPHADWVIS